MASIKGFQIKGLKTFQGRDWQGAQGNIYYNGKKVGWYNDSGNGGMADVDFYQAGDRAEMDKMTETLNAAVKAYYAEYPELDYPELMPDGELFFNRLLCLMTDEREYKHMLKAGYSYVIIYRESETSPYEQICGLRKEEEIEKFIDKNKISKCRIYRSLDDFEIK